MAARRGIALQGTGEAVLGLVGELLLPRVERWPWLGLGWPESTAASSAAAVGVRVRSESALQGVWGGVSACCVLLVRCGAR